jgi:vacuolar-type H+-ATPase subunit H
MNDVVSLLQSQTESLLRRVSREQETRTRQIRDDAAEQARAIVARARREARARLRQAIEEERRQIERALVERRAALDTEARRSGQASMRVLLERAWSQLPQAIAARWNDPATRGGWIQAACDYAADSLRQQAAFIVEFDPQAAPDAGELAQRILGARCREPVETRAVDGLGAGLRIRSGKACMDATVAGLLASRERVEAELLAEFDRVVAESAGAKPA